MTANPSRKQGLSALPLTSIFSRAAPKSWLAKKARANGSKYVPQLVSDWTKFTNSQTGCTAFVTGSVWQPSEPSWVGGDSTSPSLWERWGSWRRFPSGRCTARWSPAPGWTSPSSRRSSPTRACSRTPTACRRRLRQASRTARRRSASDGTPSWDAPPARFHCRQVCASPARRASRNSWSPDRPPPSRRGPASWRFSFSRSPRRGWNRWPAARQGLYESRTK